MERLSLPAPPQHLIHSNPGVTAAFISWAFIGVVITALGGLLAFRSQGNRTRLAAGMALTLAGVCVMGTAVLYHNSLMQAVAPN